PSGLRSLAMKSLRSLVRPHRFAQLARDPVDAHSGAVENYLTASKRMWHLRLPFKQSLRRGAVWRFGRMRVIAGPLGGKARLLTYRPPAARDWRHGLGWRAALLATWSVLATGAHSATLRAY